MRHMKFQIEGRYQPNQIRSDNHLDKRIEIDNSNRELGQLPMQSDSNPRNMRGPLNQCQVHQLELNDQNRETINGISKLRNGKVWNPTLPHIHLRFHFHKPYVMSN
ncbi:unnamed protein product [Spirodela intermedia]|uniref:Uncharacterized protein n=1 Tax=Spirodela intermedia TaxID=51605 RepID=A0A7I8LHD0_SPIIN|nr:unnamed protein product [Spirodela intermedia]